MACTMPEMCSIGVLAIGSACYGIITTVSTQFVTLMLLTSLEHSAAYSSATVLHSQV